LVYAIKALIEGDIQYDFDLAQYAFADPSVMPAMLPAMFSVFTGKI
jgi:hypothetical protein